MRKLPIFSGVAKSYYLQGKADGIAEKMKRMWPKGEAVGGQKAGDWAEAEAERLFPYASEDFYATMAAALRNAEKRGMKRASEAMTFKKPYASGQSS